MLAMVLSALVYALLGATTLVNGVTEDEFKARGRAGNGQEALGSGIDGEKYKTACPDYKHYAVVPQYVTTSSAERFARILIDFSVGR